MVAYPGLLLLGCSGYSVAAIPPSTHTTTVFVRSCGPSVPGKSPRRIWRSTDMLPPVGGRHGCGGTDCGEMPGPSLPLPKPAAARCCWGDCGGCGGCGGNGGCS